MFAGTDESAERMAILYTIVQTASAAGAEVYPYLIPVIEKIADPQFKVHQIDELLPENYAS